MSSRLHGEVEMWREYGQWRLKISAPRWVIADIVRELTFGEGGEMFLANYGGGTSTPESSDTSETVLFTINRRGPSEPSASDETTEDTK